MRKFCLNEKAPRQEHRLGAFLHMDYIYTVVKQAQSRKISCQT